MLSLILNWAAFSLLTPREAALMTFLQKAVYCVASSRWSLFCGVMGALEVGSRKLSARMSVFLGGVCSRRENIHLSHRKPLTWVSDYILYVQLIYTTIQELLCLGNWYFENSCSATDLSKKAGAINRRKTCFISYIKRLLPHWENKVMANCNDRCIPNNIVLDSMLQLKGLAGSLNPSEMLSKASPFFKFVAWHWIAS